MSISLDGNLGVYTSGNVSATGNITGNYILGNGSQLTGITASANLSNVTTDIIPASNVTYSLGNSTNQWLDLWVSNNTIYLNSVPISLSSGNDLLVNNVPVVLSSNTAPPQTANIATTANVIAGNIVVSNATPGAGVVFADGTVQTTAAGASSYGNANVSAYLASGTDTAGIDTAGNVSANYFIGNGSLLTGLPAGYSNADVQTYLASNANVVITTTGNITTTANISGNYILGNGSQLTGLPASYGNANVEAYLPSSNTIIAINANVSNTNSNVANTDANVANLVTITTDTDSNVANIASNVTTLQGQVYGNVNVSAYLGNANTTGNIYATNMNVANTVTATTFIGNFQGNISGNLVVPGSNTWVLYNNNGNAGADIGFRYNAATQDVVVGNTVTANFFVGDGSQLTGLPAAYGNANVEAYLPTSNTIIAINANIANTDSNVANLTLTVANLATTSSLANTNANVANLTTALGNTDANVANLVTITTNTNSNVANLTTSLANTDSNVANLVTITTNTNSNVANLTTALANTDSNVSNLTLTVANLATTSSLANTNSNVANTDSNVANLTTSLANTNANVANLTLATANNTSNIAQLNLAITEGVNNLANTNANVANTNSNVANLQSQVNALPVINTIPSVYLTAVANGNGQVFSNVILGGYTSNTSMTAFLNGALLENTFYELAGDVLTVNTYLNTGDNIDVITTLASNVNNVTSGYGNSNVALFFSDFAGNIVPATDDAYYLGEPANVWTAVYANTFHGDGSQLTGTYGNTNVAAYLPTYTGNITANVITANNVVTDSAIINNWTFVPQLWFVGKFSNLTIGTTQNADTLVSWNDVNDPQGWWVGGGTARVTPGIIGWYQVDYLINWTASGTAGTGQLNTQIRVNDVDVGFSQATNNQTNGLTMMQSRMIYLATITDYITFTVYTTVSGQTMSGGISASQASVRWIST